MIRTLATAVSLALLIGWGLGGCQARQGMDCHVTSDAYGMTYTELCSRTVTP